MEECGESVARQTYPAVQHYVQTDSGGHGPALVRNSLVAQTRSDWILPLDDDDLLDPGAIEAMVGRGTDHTGAVVADIIYPFCRMVGRNDGWVPNKLFAEHSLYRQPFIPVTALIRRSLFEMLAGYRNVQMEDYDFYIRALQHGARFRCLPEVLWSYRFGVNTYQGQSA